MKIHDVVEDLSLKELLNVDCMRLGVKIHKIDFNEFY